MDIRITGFEQRTAPDGADVGVYSATINGEERQVAKDPTLGSWFDVDTGDRIVEPRLEVDVALAGWRATAALHLGDE